MSQHATKKTFHQFQIFLAGQSISLFGSSIVQFALLWWINLTADDPVIISLAFTITFLPTLILSPFVGVLADLWDRKKIIMISDSIQAAITGLVIASFFVLPGINFWFVIAMNTLRGICQIFHFPAFSAVVPLMVPQDKLSRINGVRMFVSSTLRFVSPILSAIFMGFMSIEQILIIDIATYFVPFLFLLFLDIPQGHVKKTTQSSSAQKTSHFWVQFKEGFKTIKETKGLIVLAIWSLFNNFLLLPIELLLPFYIKSYHLGTAVHFAIVSSGFQIGMIIGSFISSIKKKWSFKSRWLILVGAACNLGNIILALSPIGSFYLMSAARVINGIMISIGLAIYISILQVSVPPEKQGRIFALDNFLSLCITPIAQMIAGPIASVIGVINLYLLCGGLGVFGNLSLIFTKFGKLRFEESSEPSVELKAEITEEDSMVATELAEVEVLN